MKMSRLIITTLFLLIALTLIFSGSYSVNQLLFSLDLIIGPLVYYHFFSYHVKREKIIRLSFYQCFKKLFTKIRKVQFNKETIRKTICIFFTGIFIIATFVCCLFLLDTIYAEQLHLKTSIHFGLTVALDVELLLGLLVLASLFGCWNFYSLVKEQ